MSENIQDNKVHLKGHIFSVRGYTMITHSYHATPVTMPAINYILIPTTSRICILHDIAIPGEKFSLFYIWKKDYPITIYPPNLKCQHGGNMKLSQSHTNSSHKSYKYKSSTLRTYFDPALHVYARLEVLFRKLLHIIAMLLENCWNNERKIKHKSGAC